ncbi:MAG TPA: M20/M25/M40 family metallo-hydrolase [Actinomycetota bacterium]|nr:M20/M25/M40 family metallo-hydrolase [Actinomycetota bacterium]
MNDPTGEVTELLQDLIRNKCVNTGAPESGEEFRNVDLLCAYLDGVGLDLQRYESLPGRASLVSRIEGSDPRAPSLCLMGHIDVVPVNPDGWERDPFGGELIDGVVWGRGAVDMLNTTASMAVAFKQLAAQGFKPRGDLVFFAAADEEALGSHGAQWMTENEPDAVRADYCVTEFGGMRFPIETGGGPKLPVMVGEKGTYWCTIRVHGTPGHASMPLRTDNALVTAAEVVRRLAAYQPKTELHDVWRAFVERMQFPEEMRTALLDPDSFMKLVEELPVGLARMLDACTHTTFAPTIAHGGVKTNVIPDTVDLQVDIRTLPGYSADDVRAQLKDALGDLFEKVTIVADGDSPSSASPLETPLWDTLRKVTRALVPESDTVPFLIVGATDARFMRKIGTVSYGYGMFSQRIPFNEFAQMFHGDNERVDQESLRLATELWEALAMEFLAG